MKQLRREFQIFQLALCVFLWCVNPAGAQTSRWDHRGSTMRLLTFAETGRRFHYEAISPAMSGLVRKGEILFDGRAKGMRYEGVAYSFSSKCGRIGFRVEGPIAPNYRSVTLQGKSPKRGDDCDVKEYADVTLTFDFKEKVAEDEDSVFAARTYLRDPASNNEIVLDWLDRSTLKGELFDKTGAVVSTVSGKNPRPRTLELTFAARNSSPSSGTYVWVVDEYDIHTDEAVEEQVEARWHRTVHNGSAPASLLYCDKNCRTPPVKAKDDDYADFDSFSGAVSWRGANFRSQNAGEVCIRLGAEKLSAVLALLRAEGLEAKRQKEHSGCWQDADISLTVPTGLERWAIETLRKSGKVREATFGQGTAGGSGTVTQEFSPGTFLSTSLNPRNQTELWKQSACKLRSTLNGSFRSVDVKPCDRDAKRGMCFSVVLEGHTAEEGGFSNNLNRVLDNRFLIHSELEFDATFVLTQIDPVEYIERLEWHVVGSTLARQTSSASSAQSVFREVEHWQLPGVSSYRVDRIIAGIVQQLIMAKSTVTCTA